MEKEMENILLNCGNCRKFWKIGIFPNEFQTISFADWESLDKEYEIHGFLRGAGLVIKNKKCVSVRCPYCAKDYYLCRIGKEEREKFETKITQTEAIFLDRAQKPLVSGAEADNEEIILNKPLYIFSNIELQYQSLKEHFMFGTSKIFDSDKNPYIMTYKYTLK